MSAGREQPIGENNWLCHHPTLQSTFAFLSARGGEDKHGELPSDGGEAFSQPPELHSEFAPLVFLHSSDL